MSTFREIIKAVDDCKPNGLTEKLKFLYLAELEGRIAADVMLMDIEAIRLRERKYPRDLDEEPLVGFPHQDVYRLWLEAKVDAVNGEYNKYQNSMEGYNAAYESFVRWFARTYRPAQGYPPVRCEGCSWEPPYYVGRDIWREAAERGFGGTREEFWQKLLAAINREQEGDQ